MPSTNIASEALEGYESTDYLIKSDPDILFKVGEPCEGITKLFARHGVDCGAFITAFNPQGNIVSDEQNQKNHELLTQEIQQRAIPFLTCIGSPASATWPPEIGFFLLGADLSFAKEAGQKFDQDAIVWVPHNAVPQLVLLR